MSFLKVFKSEVPNIIEKLKAIRKDIDDTKSCLNQLVDIENKTGEIDITTITDSFNVSLWAKDLDGRFLFVNKACCDTILKCSLQEAMSMANGDFRKDALSRVCMASDKLVLQKGSSMRFIEHAVYESGDIYLDVLKSPLYKDGRIAGTTGIGIIITDNIPERIKEQTRKSNSIEIPVNLTMSDAMFVRFLERRKGERLI